MAHSSPDYKQSAPELRIFTWRRGQTVDPSVHWHNDLELNYTKTGSLTYLIGSEVHRIPGKRLAVFWAARAHRLLEVANPVNFVAMHVPLALFLRWSFSDTFVRGVLGGHIVLSSSDAYAQRDYERLCRWEADLESGDPARKRIVILELHARLWRMSLDTAPELSERLPSDHAEGGLNVEEKDKVAAISAYVATHYTEPIAVSDIAEAVGVHPNYAMSLFNERCGISLMGYVLKHRVAHAQYLLANTNERILDVALIAGFGSISRFYAAFHEAVGQSPSEYRSFMRSNPAS